MAKRQKLSKESKAGPFYKQRWFIGVTSVLTVAATLIGMWRLIFPPKPPTLPTPIYENAEIVLDGSSSMDEPFDGTTKLKAAAEAIHMVLRNEGLERNNLAFRVFGGPCDAGATEPTLRFSTKNEGPISKAVDALTAQGRASLVQALLQAITDFDDVARFKDVSKRVIVITGNPDACGKSLESVRRKLDHLKEVGSRVDLDFHFIGVGLDEPGKSQVSGLAHETGGVADFADNRQQLQDLLSGAVISTAPAPDHSPETVQRESVMRSGKAVLDNLNSSAGSLITVIGDLNKRNYEAGDRDLEQARIEFRKSELAFEDLGRRQTSDQYRRIYEAASNNRKIIEQMISLTKTMLSQARANDPSGFHASMVKYQGLKVDYNNRIDDLDRQLKDLAAMKR